MSKVGKKSRVAQKVINKLLLLSGRYLAFVRWRGRSSIGRPMSIRVNLAVRDSRAHDAHDLRIRRTSELTATFVSRCLRQRGNWSQTAGNTGFNLVVIGPTAEQSEPPTEPSLRRPHPSARGVTSENINPNVYRTVPVYIYICIYICIGYRYLRRTHTHYYYYYYYCQKDGNAIFFVCF